MVKILVCDDSETIRNIICKSVEGEIFEAGTVEEAIEKYKENKPDLVFMDIIFPGKNGIKGLEEIKKIDSNAKVIMLSAVIEQESIMEEINELGATAVLKKPFGIEAIQEMVKKFILGEYDG